MKEGKVVEEGRTAEVLSCPCQQYTKNLLSAMPIIE
jgi:ABC-type oligopeptide transport system ATPase subunit